MPESNLLLVRKRRVVEFATESPALSAPTYSTSSTSARPSSNRAIQRGNILQILILCLHVLSNIGVNMPIPPLAYACNKCSSISLQSFFIQFLHSRVSYAICTGTIYAYNSMTSWSIDCHNPFFDSSLSSSSHKTGPPRHDCVM